MAGSEQTIFDSFERLLQTTEVDLDFLLSDLFAQVLCEFHLNPRYLRGSDFLMRFSQGRWAEDIVMRTINATKDFRAIPYGPSSVAPSDPREMELYFERLGKAGHRPGDHPDLGLGPMRQGGQGDVAHRAGRDHRIGLGEHRPPAEQLALRRQPARWARIGAFGHRSPFVLLPLVIGAYPRPAKGAAPAWFGGWFGTDGPYAGVGGGIGGRR